MGGEAFMPIDEMLKKMPFEKVGIRPEALPYSFYELFFHITFAQKDILEYTISGDYKTSQWPDDYWPDSVKPKDEKNWEKLKKDFFDDREMLKEFVADKKNKLDAAVRNSEDHTLLRELMLVIEHSAYHTGQMLVVMRLLGVYEN
ncbi:hypothetical protein C7S20_11390 [Christiangramia fulva]|uniref:DinB family protein n=2 Tax=Christiangramia fulva TaxID=2126553 RepID=A0A2R3ZAX7_9FLAO|nr:hypothetical protein C7S20_11390 [Christiangramia fulva]